MYETPLFPIPLPGGDGGVDVGAGGRVGALIIFPSLCLTTFFQDSTKG